MAWAAVTVEEKQEHHVPVSSPCRTLSVLHCVTPPNMSEVKFLTLQVHSAN